MGVFSEVVFTCPECNEFVSIQAGDGCITYYEDSIPLDVAKEIKDQWVHCGTCGVGYQIKIGAKPRMGIQMHLE